MRRLITVGLLAFLFININAQDNQGGDKKEKPVEVKLSGFIMNNLTFDTRKNVEAIDGGLILYPLPKSLDASGEDLNSVPSVSLLSLASRLKTSVTGPDAFGATTTGYMEFDFTSRANSVTVRFRQAWAKLTWTNSELLIGRTWHPIVSIDVIPSVMALSIGAPFQPFNRSEQITFTQKFGKTHLIVSAIYQNDYTNNGPNGKSFLYQTNALIPNLHAQLKYKSSNIIAGAGVDFKLLKPRNSVKSQTTQAETKVNKTVPCFALLAYGQYKTGKLTISGKTILGANISEDLMPGAYGISAYDPATGKEEYTTYKHFYLWGNISYGNALKANLFGGFLKNLGASENIIAPTATFPTVFGSGETISEMFRITPTISYTAGKVILAFEMENNIVSYGTINYANKGKITNADKVFGTRLLCTMYYNF